MPFPFFKSRKQGKTDPALKPPKPEPALTHWGFPYTYNATGRLYQHPRGPGLEVYRRMREDAQVAAGLAVIKLPILAAAWSINGGDAEAGSFISEMLGGYWRKLLQALLMALDYGFSALEKVFDLDDDGRIVIREFRDPDPASLVLNVDENGSLIGFTQLPDIEVPLERTLIYTNRGEHGNHYGISRLRSAYEAWHAKELIFLYANRYYERRGSPITMVKYPPNPQVSSEGVLTGDSNSDQALRLGESLFNNSVVALPKVYDATGNEQWEISFLEDNSKGAGFIDYMNYLDKLILRALFVPERTITQDQATGSYSMAQAHQDAFLLSLDGLIADLEETINQGVIEPLLIYNFGSGKHKPRIKLSIERLSRSRRQAVANLAQQMLSSGALKLDPRQVADLLDLPLEVESSQDKRIDQLDVEEKTVVDKEEQKGQPDADKMATAP